MVDERDWRVIKPEDLGIWLLGSSWTRGVCRDVKARI